MTPIPDTPETQETRQEPKCAKCQDRGYVILEGGYPLDCYVCKPSSSSREPRPLGLVIDPNAPSLSLTISEPREPQKDETPLTPRERLSFGQGFQREPREQHAALIAEIDAVIDGAERDAARCDKNIAGWRASTYPEAADKVSALTVDARQYRQTADLLRRCLIALKGA